MAQSMARHGFTVVFDIGKTTLKLCFVEPDGTIAETHSAENAVTGTSPYPHYDVERTWTWLTSTLRASQLSSDARSFVVSAHGAAAALVSGSSLVLPVLDYEFPDVNSVDAEYDAQRDPYSQTLSPNLPLGLNLGRQLFWLQDTFPDAFARTQSILMYPQFWAWKLTGRLSTEVTSLGCHTDLWLPSQSKFSALARARGWAQRFPELVGAWSPIGLAHPDICRETGLSAECRVYPGVHDSNASLLPHVKERGSNPFTVISTGTWVVVMARGGDVARLDETKDMLANIDIYGDVVPCARFMGGREFAHLAGADGIALDVGEQPIIRLVADGILALPGFASEGGPFRGARGEIRGALEDTREAKAALARLYCALVTDYCLDRLGAEGDIIVEGSFANSEGFTRSLAAFRTTQPVYASDDRTGTVAGASLLAHWQEAASLSKRNRVRPFTVPGLQVYKLAWREAVEARQQ